MRLRLLPALKSVFASSTPRVNFVDLVCCAEMRKKFDAGIDPLDPESQNQGQGRGGGFNPFGQGGGGFKFHFGGGGGGFHDFHDEF